MYLMDYEYRLPKVLVARMQEKKLSFKRLSQLSTVNIKTLYHWAGGQTPRNPVALYRVAMVLEIPMEVLLFGTAAHMKQTPDPQSYELVLYRISSEGIRQLVSGHKE